MTAIVLDHEQPHEKARGRHRKQQAKPVAKIKRCPHQKPEQNKRSGRDDELDNAACRVRRAIAGKGLCPAAGVGHDTGRGRNFFLLCKRIAGMEASPGCWIAAWLKPSVRSFAIGICAKLTTFE